MRIFFVFSILGLLVSCMGPAPLSSLASAPKEPAVPGGPAERCQVSDLRVHPTSDVPAPRTAPLLLSFAGATPDLKLAVGTASGEVAGALFLDEASALFIPQRPYPAGAVVQWRASACGEIFEGSFFSGALHHALGTQELREVYAGRAWALDLRAADWDEPPLGTSSRAPYALGGALLVELEPARPGELAVRLAPARVDSSGTFPQAEGSVFEDFIRFEEGDAYARLEIPAITLSSRGGPVRLTEVELVLGLDARGPRDGRLAASIDLRDWRGDDGRQGCALLADEAGVECGPCAEDGAFACAALELGQVAGGLTSVRLERAR